MMTSCGRSELPASRVGRLKIMQNLNGETLNARSPAVLNNEKKNYLNQPLMGLSFPSMKLGSSDQYGA
jgi:hypothetical protein